MNMMLLLVLACTGKPVESAETGDTQGGPVDSDTAESGPSESGEDSDPEETSGDDADGDGLSSAEGDCDDGNASVHPGAEEVPYDGLDNDCTGGDLTDVDADGYPAVEAGGTDCYDAVDVDCLLYDGSEAGCGYPLSGPLYADDAHGLAVYEPSAIHPGVGVSTSPDAIHQTEWAAWYGDSLDNWYDGTDQNCDGRHDHDFDGDGYPIYEECDDLDASLSPDPGVEEVWGNCVDENCDGNFADQDDDGWVAAGTEETCPDALEGSAWLGDCADDPADTASGAACNGFPDLSADDLSPGATDTPYDCVDANCDGADDFDVDGDGQRTMSHPGPDGVYGTDCDDTDASIYTGAPDTWYDGVDSDCAGNNDYDVDGDGYSDASDPGAVEVDCDDTRAEVNPGEPEICDEAGVDEDCSGSDNDAGAVGCTDLYMDGDGDGYAGADASACLCYAEGGFEYPVESVSDCDDGDSSVHPDAVEDCDSTVDDNCDGNTNDEDGLDCLAFYPDADMDTYGTDDARCLCEEEGIYTGVRGGDCDDTDPDVRPSEMEVCDYVDNNCDGVVNEGFRDYYPDVDGDGWGDGTVTPHCSTTGTTIPGDCDDTDVAVNPDMAESCNDIDDNCDSAIDEGLAVYYFDEDGDGHGLAGAEQDCSYTGAVDDDCLDSNAEVYPGAPEQCPADYDYDCDGETNEVDAVGCTNRYQDGDGDGYGTSSVECRCDAAGSYTASVDGDCDDAAASTYPRATEVCDFEDDDCDGSIDESVMRWPDVDGDGYGDGAAAYTCNSGDVTNDDDCDDASDGTYPGAPELCDMVKNDCRIAEEDWDDELEDGTLSLLDADGSWSALDVSLDASEVTIVSVSNGDQYFACFGDYYVRFVVDRGAEASILGLSPGSTVFHGNYEGPVLQQSGGGTLTAASFSAVEGGGVLDGSVTYGGLVYVSDSVMDSTPNLVLSDCALSGGDLSTGTSYGGALAAVNQAWVQIDDCSISDSYAMYGGGMAVIGDSSSSTDALVEVSNSQVVSNDAAYGGGIYASQFSDVLLTGTGVSSNIASENGGGMYLRNALISVDCSSGSGSVLLNESGVYGGGAALHTGTGATLTSTSCNWGAPGFSNNDCPGGTSCGDDVAINQSGSTWQTYSSFSSAATFSCTSGSSGQCL